MQSRGKRAAAKTKDVEDKVEKEVKKPTPRGKGKRKADAEPEKVDIVEKVDTLDTTEDTGADVPTDKEVAKTLKDNKKKAKVESTPQTSVSDVDFSVFTKSIVDVLTIPDVATIERGAFEKEFDRIADTLLNKTVVFIAGRPHRLSEIEFYCNGHKHPDEFAHGSDMQKQRAKWYFHMVGKSYKAGSFKGLDITFGDEKLIGGILLRSIQPIGGNLIEGPSLLVDHVLSTTSFAKIDDLVKTFDLSAENTSQSKTHPMFVGVTEADLDYLPRKDVVKSARVGLTLKRFKEGKEGYLGSRYRYMINPETIKKGKHYTIVGLHQDGKDSATISKIAKSPKNTVEKYIASYEKGKKKAWRSYIDADLDPEATCEAIGACAV